jgi:hypothetical protein
VAPLGDSINSEHEREFAELKRSRRKVVRFAVGGAALVYMFMLLFSALSGVAPVRGSLDVARTELLSSGLPEVRAIADTHAGLARWLHDHGTGGESAVFERVARSTFGSATSFAERFRDGSEPGIFSRIYLGLHGGILRLAFVVLSGWRLWVVAILGVMCWVYMRIRVHTDDDILGVTGNGRLFYSGARVDLSKTTERGAPDILIPGLACPARESTTVARSAALGKLLTDFGAANETTLGLVGVVLKRGDIPAFVADYDHEDALRRVFSGAALAEQAERTLRVALELHRSYREQVDTATAPREPVRALTLEEPLSGAEYTALLQHALVRVLTPGQREALGRLEPSDIAVLVLGLEAGKVLVHVKEGGRWIRRSRFPQLCARAVVHSLPSFGREYSYDSRQAIRRAFVYGSRKSDFAPVRFPLDLSPESRAARQWVEILMASPHELAATADEVELLAILTEGYQRWNELFFDEDTTAELAGFEGSYATHGNLFVMPLARVVALLRRAIAAPERARLETLMQAVSNRQRVQVLAREPGGETGTERVLPSYERVLVPLAAAEAKALAEFHGVSIDDVRAWSALRLVLNSFGWLARRVGDSTVPETSLVAGILSVGVGAPGANHLGLVGQRGLVPLRGSHLEAVWGRSWRDRFTLVDRIRTAETNEDFAKRMQGVESLEDDPAQTATV